MMTDIEYKLFTKIKKIYGDEHKNLNYHILIVSIILALSYVAFFLSLANADLFQKWLLVARAIFAIGFIASTLRLFKIARNLGDSSTKVETTESILRKTKALLKEYRYDTCI